MKMNKTMVDKGLRDKVFEDLFIEGRYLDGNRTPIIKDGYQKINDRQYGTILTDANGNERYVRIGVIVAEEREDMTAEELMQSEIDAYNAKQEAKAEKAKAKEAKIAKDKARREKEKEEQENA